MNQMSKTVSRLTNYDAAYVLGWLGESGKPKWLHSKFSVTLNRDVSFKRPLQNLNAREFYISVSQSFCKLLFLDVFLAARRMVNI